MPEIVGFDRESAERVLQATRDYEGDIGNTPISSLRGTRQPTTSSWLVVLKVTSLTLTSTYYPCQWQDYNVDARTFADGGTEAGWVKGPNNEALRLNKFYIGRLQGVLTADSKLVFLTAGAGGASPFPAKLTSSSGTAYAWTEQIEAAAGTFTNGTRTGTTTLNPAYELNGKRNLDLLIPQPIVWLFAGFLNSGGADQEYLFSYHSEDWFLTGGTETGRITRHELNSAASTVALGVDWETDVATNGLIKIRHKGLTINVFMLTSCTAGVLMKRLFYFENGLLKRIDDEELA